MAQAGGKPDGDLFEFADSFVADEFAGEPEPAAAALLGAGLENDFVLANGADDMMPLVDGQGQRLFTIDILARVGGGDIDQRMPVIGRAIDDDVDVASLHDLSHIVIFVRSFAVGGELLGGGGGVGVINVAHGENLGAFLAGVIGVAPPLAAATDEGDGNAVIGSDVGCRGGPGKVALDEPGGQAGGGGGQRATFEEGTARNEEIFGDHAAI